MVSVETNIHAPPADVNDFSNIEGVLFIIAIHGNEHVSLNESRPWAWQRKTTSFFLSVRDLKFLAFITAILPVDVVISSWLFPHV